MISHVHEKQDDELTGFIMCGRYSLTASMELLEENFGLTKRFITKPRYNIAPTQMIPVCKILGEIDFLRWGFLPSFQRPNQTISGWINARSETLLERPAFRRAFEKQRCLVIADGFYEWKSSGRLKQPYYIRRKDRAPFAMAGLWQGDTCAIITKEACLNLVSIHMRMPVILSKEMYSQWLDSKVNINHGILPLIHHENSMAWEIYPVSTRVNHASFDSPECIHSLH